MMAVLAFLALLIVRAIFQTALLNLLSFLAAFFVVVYLLVDSAMVKERYRQLEFTFKAIAVSRKEGIHKILKMETVIVIYLLIMIIELYNEQFEITGVNVEIDEDSVYLNLKNGDRIRVKPFKPYKEEFGLPAMTDFINERMKMNEVV